MYKSREKIAVLCIGILIVLSIWGMLSVQCLAAEKNNDEKQSQIICVGSFEDTFNFVDNNGVRQNFSPN